jgi:hypothetical protein
VFHWRVNALLVLAVMFFTPSMCTAQCPMNTIDLHGFDTRVLFTGTAAAKDTSAIGSIGTAKSSYDLDNGFFTSQAVGDADAIVSTYDTFMLSGVSSTTPTAFQAHLTILGTINTAESQSISRSANITARLTEGSSNIIALFRSVHSMASPPYGALVDSTLTINISAIAGTLINVKVYIRTHSTHNGSRGADFRTGNYGAQLHFTGLPPGASLVSCQGYTSESPIPVISSTWSSIKSLY